MPASSVLLDHDWLGLCRRSAEGLRLLLDEAPTSRRARRRDGGRRRGRRPHARDRPPGRGRRLRRAAGLHDAGARFTAVSEERGIVDFGDPGLLVVVDPIDGSLNAKRGLRHHALSIAVADGPTMADVLLGYVYDVGAARGVARRARRRGVAERRAARRRRARAPRRTAGSRSSRSSPRRRAARRRRRRCSQTAYRVRAIGAIAISMCQVAAGRVDAMASLGRCRSVDAAAAQLDRARVRRPRRLPVVPVPARGAARRSRPAAPRSSRRAPRRPRRARGSRRTVIAWDLADGRASVAGGGGGGAPSRCRATSRTWAARAEEAVVAYTGLAPAERRCRARRTSSRGAGRGEPRAHADADRAARRRRSTSGRAASRPAARRRRRPLGAEVGALLGTWAAAFSGSTRSRCRR